MTERSEHVKALYREALARPLAERQEFLDRACGDDADVRRHVESLLDAKRPGENLVDTMVVEGRDAPSATDTSPVVSGETIGPYVVVEPLGAGGMGEVYLAYDARLGRRIALKLLPAAVGSDREHVARFEQEARAAARLVHPNVCVIHDIGVTEDGRRFIAMEYVEGETLRARMAKGRRELVEILSVAGQVAVGLAAAHAAGIVHRDVKPENIMVRPDGYAKVLDFGIAKLAERPDEKPPGTTLALVQTASDVVMGTVAYMSPEQARGQPLDGRTDIWSLGVILYELVAGRHPFSGTTVADFRASILREEPEPLSAVAPGTPTEIERIVDRALRKPIEQRYRDAAQLALDLERARSELSSSHARSTDADATGVTKVMKVSPESPSMVGAVADATTVPNNLSYAVTSFVGREREVADVNGRLESGRLVTLTGTGGIGKTRLALRIAADALDRYPGGVWSIDLSYIRQPGAIAEALASTIGLREQPGRSLVDTVAEHLRPRRVLLVVDGCEHVLEACGALVERLLRSCPRLTVLATSREPLNIHGELVWSLAPLSMPPADSGPLRASSSLEYEAVALFRERAALANPAFEITDRNASAVADVCRRLDGLPLAIELAAVRIKSLSVEQIAARLGNHLSFLTRAARTAPARQQTLRATIDWSHDLLSHEERALFRRLAVFGGGWTVPAAEAACAGGVVDRDRILDALERLADKSLVTLSEGETGMRYRMLESVHQYAGEKLAEADEDDLVRRAHLNWFAAFAEQAGEQLRGTRSSEWIARLEADRHNVEAALLWSRAEGDVETVARIAKSQSFFWYLRGHWNNQIWLRHLLAQGSLSDASRVEVLEALGGFAYVTGDYEKAEELVQECLDAKRVLGNMRSVAGTLLLQGAIAETRGDHDRARACYGESLSLSEGLESPRGIADALRSLGGLEIADGNLDIAEELLTRAITSVAPSGASYDNLNFVPLDLAEIARLRGDLELAESLVSNVLSDVRAKGFKHTLGVSLYQMGQIARDAGRTAEALTHYVEALVIAEELGDRANLAMALEGLATAGAALGQARESLRFAGAAAAIRERCRLPLSARDAPEIERLLAPARVQLGDDEARRAYEGGASLTQAEARREAELLLR